MWELLAVILDLLSSVIELIAYSMLGKPTTKRIEKNADRLREFDWFKELYSNEKYRRLIQFDQNIRYEIGKARVRKIMNDRYAEDKFRLKLIEMLEEAAERPAGKKMNGNMAPAEK